MSKLTYLIGYVTLVLLLHYLDTSTTHYLVQNAEGEEVNWTVNTTSFISILLSPGPIIILVLCINGLYLAEYDPQKASQRLRDNGWFRLLFALPYLYLPMKTFAVVSNTSVVLGYGDLFSWLSIIVGDNYFLGLCLMYTISAVILMPFVEKYLKRRFPVPVDQASSQSD